MNRQEIEILSAVIGLIGSLPYYWHTYHRQIEPQMTSWVLWAFIGLAILLTYDSAGDGASFWVALLSFINPTIIALMLMFQGGKWRKLEWYEMLCIAFSIGALGFWLWVRDNKELAQYALYLVIIADLCAAVPTIKFVWTNPFGDRPFAWLVFGLGMAVSLLAVIDWTPANTAYAIYMVLGSSSTALPLVLYRIKARTPLKKWI